MLYALCRVFAGEEVESAVICVTDRHLVRLVRVRTRRNCVRRKYLVLSTQNSFHCCSFHMRFVSEETLLLLNGVLAIVPDSKEKNG